MDEIYLYGDSHGWAFDKAATMLKDIVNLHARMVAPARILDEFVVRSMKGDVEINPLIRFALYRDRNSRDFANIPVSEDGGQRMIIFALGTSDAHRQTLRFFDHTVVPLNALDCKTDPGKIYVPHAAMQRLAEVRLSLFLQGLDLLKSVCLYKFAVLESPPPTPDDAFIVRHQPSFRRRGITNRTDVIPDREFRMRRWVTTNQAVADHCEKSGIKFIANPDFVMDNKGFLRQQYWRDGTHANEKYGFQVANYIAENWD